ncbi:MAG: hypothetical protein WHV63_08040 [Ignavibacteria bacterium]|jgi:hypothetical protein|nr:hypothetical protein [Ignavibacteria bacterium]MDH7528403.1 hypothetical protein [Ignavibacteria bacterium]
MRIFLILLLLQIITQSPEKLILDENYPIWLKDNEKHSDQTSGITFIGTKNNAKYFLICDDIGKIHRIKLKNNKLDIETIKFSKSVENFLDKFEKKDFEEIVYDKFTNRVYISIEGNGLNYKNEVGIYQVRFNNDDVFSDEIIDITKIEFSDWAKISKYTDQNIGFEGLGISENKLFLGLEGFQFGQIFLDSTMLYVVDKNSKKLVREISTKELGIHTICGLYAIDDYHLYGIDRNQQHFFEIVFDRDYNVIKCDLVKLELPVPGNKKFKYVAAIESITVDDERNVYVVDDPWKKFYVPPRDVLSQLRDEDQENFKKFIPLLFKYKLN